MDTNLMVINAACWNVRRGLSKREKEIEEMLRVYQLDILFLLETDTTMIMEEKDYKLCLIICKLNLFIIFI